MSTSLQSLKTYMAAYQQESGLQDSVAGLEVCSRYRCSLPQGPLHLCDTVDYVQLTGVAVSAPVLSNGDTVYHVQHSGEDVSAPTQ